MAVMLKKEEILFGDEIVPSAPPSYEAVDVVDEFAKRFQNRKDCIRGGFQKKRVSLECQYQKQLEQLNKEESNALAQLHASYVQWVNVEPPEIICSQPFFSLPQGGTSKQTSGQSSTQSLLTTAWRWFPSQLFTS